MHYQVSRNGQMYGPYTLEDLQRYLASGNILPTDMAKTEEMTEWVPVSQIVAPAAPAAEGGFSTPSFANPAEAAYVPVAGAVPVIAASQYPDAPNLHWGLVLLFGILTCTLFMPIWNLVISAWLRKVQPNANALFFYVGVLILIVINFMVGAATSAHMMTHPGASPAMSVMGPMFGIRLLLWLVIFVVKLIARFSERASLQEHYNTVEPIGLSLNPVLTFFFGGIYFQSELNRINAMKQAARYGGRAY